MLAHDGGESLLADGFESAFVGVACRPGQPPLAAYSYQRAIDVLIKRDSLSYEEAQEWLDFNVVSAWAGEHTPLWLYEPVDEDEFYTEDVEPV